MSLEVENTFVISIKQDGAAHTIAAHSSKITVDPLPFPNLQELLNEEQRSLLQSFGKETANASPAEIQAIGQTLYKALFPTPIAVAYGQSQNQNKNDVATRLCLQVESPELAALPWEALHDGHEWLALNPNAPLVRRIVQGDEAKVLKKLQVRGAVKILFVGASPDDQPKLEIEAALQSLQERLQEPLAKKKIVLDSMLNPTLEQLQERLGRDYHILYFSGHGSPKGIFVNDGYDGSEVVSAETLAQALKGKATRLVYLAACNTSAQTNAKAGLLLESFAQELAERANLPAIVAMQYYLSNMNANLMSGHFFAMLAQFKPVDVALADARSVAKVEDAVGRDVLAPVMYLQAEDGSLFQKARNWPFLAALVALILAVLIGGYFGIQREIDKRNAATAVAIERTQKEREAAFARSRQLAKKSSDELNVDNYELSILLAIESGLITDTLESFGAIRAAIANPWHSRIVLYGHTNEINSAFWLQNSTRVVTIDKDKIARVWDATTGKQLAKFGEFIQTNLIKNDIQFLTSECDEADLYGNCVLGTTIIWEVATGKELEKFEGVYQETLNEDKTHILTINHKNNIAHIWDTATRREIVKLLDVYQWILSQDKTRILTVNRQDNTAHLWDTATGRELIRLDGHFEVVSQALWSQDKNRILTVNEQDNSTHIWDTTTGRELTELAWHIEFVTEAIWSQDKTRILTGSCEELDIRGDDCVLYSSRIWDATSGKELLKFEGGRQLIWSKDETRILSINFGYYRDARAGIWDAITGKELVKLEGVTQALWNKNKTRILIVNSQDDSARIWEATTGKELVKLKGGSSANWSKDETYILTVSSQDNITRILDAVSGNELVQLEGVSSATWSDDETYVLLINNQDNVASLWDIAGDKELVELDGHIESVNWATWSKAGRRILINENDITRIWDMESGKQLAKLTGVTEAIWNHDESRILIVGKDAARILDTEGGNELLNLKAHVTSRTQVIWSQDERRILTIGGDTVLIWDAQNGKELRRLKGHTRPIIQAVWSQDESHILTVTADGTQHIWNLATGEEIAKREGPTDRAYLPTWGKNNDPLLMLTEGYKTMRIWDVANRKELAMLRGHAMPIIQATLSKDKRFVVTSSYDDTMRVWDIATGKELVKYQMYMGPAIQATWSQDQSRILTVNSQNDTVRIWDVATGKELIKLEGHTEYVFQAAWSRDGNRILTSSQDNTARIWDAVTGKELIKLDDHTGPVYQAMWSQDESKVLTPSGDGTVRIWDAVTGKELIKLDDHTGPVYQAVWSQDESKVLTVDGDGTVRLSYVYMRDLIKAACQWAPRSMTMNEWNLHMEDIYRQTCPTSVLPLDVIADIQKQSKDLVQSGNYVTATYKLDQLNKWLQTTGQWQQFGISPAQFIVEQATEIARRGEITMAIISYQEALRLDPELPITPELEAGRIYAPVVVEQANELANRGEITASLDAISQALRLDPVVEIDVHIWNAICWNGGLAELATQVMPACENAVAAAPGDGNILDSRGLALALTGNLERAVKDFESAVKLAKETGDNEEFIKSRQEWIDALNNGKNPFTPELLEQLKN